MIDPSELESRKRLAAEMILENEGLTDDLSDEEAKALIGWGVRQAESYALATEDLVDEEEARLAVKRGVAQVRQAMRDINRRVGRGDVPDLNAALAEESRLTTPAEEQMTSRMKESSLSLEREEVERSGEDEPSPPGVLKRLWNQIFGREGETS